MSEHTGIYVIGAGGHAKVVVSMLQAGGYRTDAVLDDDTRRWGEELLGVPVTGPVGKLKGLNPVEAVIAVGNNAARRSVAGRLQGVEWVTVRHPYALVHPSVRLGPGTVVFAGAVIQPDAVVGAHSIINTGATIDHDCVIGDYAHVAPGVHLAGGVHLGQGVFLGIGAAVVPGAKIGSRTVVGAGGVVVGDLPADVVAVGVPAKPVKRATSTR